MLKNFSFVVAVAILIFFTQGTEAEIFRNQADLDASVGFAQSSIFDSVGLFTGDDANGDSFIAGSGVFIGNGLDGQNAWVLTAGHVLFDEPNLPWDSQQFNPSADVGANLSNFLDVEEVFPFPEFTGSEAGGGTGNDIGLVKLSAPLTGITAATLFDGPDDGLIGAEFVTAGYGNPGVFGQPLGDFDGIRRGGGNIIESAGANFPQVQVEEQFFVSDFDAFSNDALLLEWQGTPNDSGSPWFVNVNGEYQIAGIVNGGLTSFTDSFAIRTSLFNDFIDDTIAANSTAVPEPGTMCLLTLGLLGGAIRRRRKAVEGKEVFHA